MAPGTWRLLKTTAAGGGVFALDDGLGVRTYQPRTIATKPTVKAAPPRPVLWSEKATAWQQAAGPQVQALADLLGVDAAALRSIGCGWDQAKRAWTFPTRDGDGAVVGIAQRFDSPRKNRNGDTITKAMVTGSRQGLFFDPATWSQGDGPILLVEGASDTAAAITMGLAVVGRPSNRGGSDHLARLLRDIPDSRPIVVVGERDQKPDGLWPGRDGAVTTATRLANDLHREVLWAMPPDGAKDTREFLQAVSSLLGDRTSHQRIGRGLADALLEDAEAVAGAPAPIIEQQQQQAGPARDLSAWRSDIEAARMKSVLVPGLHLDRSQTGSGKTFATIEATKQASKSLTVLPTHANVQERVEEMRAAGIPAVAFPDLNESTCKNYGEASRAQAAGLPVGQSACIGCAFKDDCDYKRGVDAAKNADHRVGTHARLIRSPGAAKDCSLVVIDENPVAVLGPSLTASPVGIESVANLAHRIMTRGLKSGDRSGSLTFARMMVETCDAILETIGDATAPGRYPVALPPTGEIPDHWQAVLWQSMQRLDAADDPGSEALQLVTRAATGEFDRLDIVVERTPGGLLSHLAFCAWRTPVDPDYVSYQLLDATAEPEDVAAVAGAAVDDCTPHGFLPARQAVVQVPLSITGSTSPAKVAGILRGILARYPQYQRVGLIGHSRHIKALMNDGSDLLDADTRSRIAKHCYFWEGPDRASNDWHQVCDVVLVMGVPRPNPSAIRQRLLLVGLDEAATIPAPVWGDRHWTATTTEGGTVTVPGRGYHHPDWHRAHAAACRSQLLQAMGRARSILPEGVPCLVVADEPTGAPVDTAPIQTLAPAVQQVVDAIRRLGECQLPAIGSPIREKLTFPPVTTRALLADRAFSGMTRQALHKRLTQARSLGLVHSPGHGLWAITAKESLPMTVTGPAEPVSVAVAIADPIPEATISVTTAAPPTAAWDDLQAAVAERAALMEFDGGLDRQQAERLAMESILAPALASGRSGLTHQQVAGNCTVQREANQPAKAAPERPPSPLTGASQAGLWTPSELRQLNPWGG